MRSAISLAAAVTLALAGAVGCYQLPSPTVDEVSSFDVQVLGVYRRLSTTTRGALPVSPICADRYGGDVFVPAAARGKADCPYQIPRDETGVELDIRVTALGLDGKPLTTFARTVAAKTVPGELTGSYDNRKVTMKNGTGTATVRAARLYGNVRVWAEDAPPVLAYADGGVSGSPGAEPVGLDGGSVRTSAAGVSDVVFFEEPTLQAMQRPDRFDNRSSPFVSQFLNIGKNPESGSILHQTCPGIPTESQPEVKMVVTGIDTAGFFVTDLTACPIPEQVTDANGNTVVQSPEPSGALPGTFGSVYVYNYNYPDGLFVGDLLWTISGSVQEFTSTTQLTFAAWSIRESVRMTRPEPDWDIHLRQITPYTITNRTCGQTETPRAASDDLLCGFQTNNLKLESLESSLVRLANVKVPEIFAFCDLNGNGEVPFFCSTGTGFGPCSSAPEPEAAEMQCYIDCTTSSGPYAGKRCTEGSSFNGFGQFVVELPGAGPAVAGLDPTIPQRLQEVAVSTTAARTPQFYGDKALVKVWCDTEVHYAVGTSTVTATTADPVIPANTVFPLTTSGTQSYLSYVTEGATGTCSSGPDPRTRFLAIFQDVLPEVDLECTVDATPEGIDCQRLREASYDIVGHLRQVQPARPRWMVLPRDADDVCCRPGPSGECHSKIQKCQ